MSEEQQKEMKEKIQEIVALLNGQTYDFCDYLIDALREELRSKSVVNK